MDCFLAGQESIRSRVADAEKTDEFVARRCTHDFLYLFSFIGYWDMKRGPSPSAVAASSIFSKAHQAEAK